MAAITAIFSMGKILNIEIPEEIHQEIEHVYDNILFYDEHTHGAAESVSDPLSQNTINQWGMKAAYAWEAAKSSHALEEKALAFIEPALNKSSLPTIAVFNTLNWERSGLVNLFLPHEIISEGVDFTITDVHGKEIPWQRYEQRMEGAYFGLWVEDIPPMGYKTLQVNVGEKSIDIDTREAKESFLENDFYRIHIDEKKGIITTIYDKEVQAELIDPKDNYTLGQVIYEELENRHQMERLTNLTRDTIYKPFPFNLEGGNLAFEAQGGVVYPGLNQLEGSASDWNTIQNFAAVKGEDAQIVFVSPEIPLVQFGAINTGRYYYNHRPKTNHIYSWVLNNYWVTNFKASQEGELQWTYSITSSLDRSDMFATKYGWGERVPLKSRILFPSKGASETKLESKSLIDIAVPKLLLVNTSLSADNKGIILHLREVEGDHAILDIRRLLEETNASSAYEVNILEEELKLLTGPILIEHFETRFIKLKF